ncbi:YceI family protein [Bauldia sp.]|uniref:YceI family protein n=1 Tax=Bauldia sp. TaxID=2575872 RepID=UPI003BAB2C4D
MRNLKYRLAAVAAASCLITPALAADAFTIDQSHTSVVFFIDHLGYSDLIGRFNDVSGTFDFDQENIENSNIALVIDATSIDTNHEPRDDHLRSPDFLNVEEFPEITFESTAIEQTGDTTGEVTGDMTILGVTQPVTFAVTLNQIAPNPQSGDMVAGFSARAQVDRSDFGMTFGQGGIGDVLDLFIEVEGIQQ